MQRIGEYPTRANTVFSRSKLLTAAMLTLALLIGGCASRRCQYADEVAQLTSGNRSEAIQQLHAAGMKAIPCLIAAISDTTPYIHL